MLSKKMFVSGILAIVMVLSGAACTPAELQALRGTLQNIDSVSGNVTVKLKDGTIQSFNLTDVSVGTVRDALGNANLEIGDEIVVKARKDGKVEEVETERAEVGGVIKSLGSNNVTITTKKQGDITLLVTPNTTIRNRGTGNFSSLQVGQRVEVKYDVNTMTALRININFEDAEDHVTGTIKAVDTANNTVTITSKKGDITLKVTANTSIRIEEKRTATLADLKAGQKIEAKYEIATLNAVRISAENAGEEKGDDSRAADKRSDNRSDNRSENREKGRDR